MTATLLADEAARLLLAGERLWWGRGKWVARELADLDGDRGSAWATRHEQALRETATGNPDALVASVARRSHAMVARSSRVIA